MGFISKAIGLAKNKLGITKRPAGSQATITKQATVATMSDEDKLARDMANVAYDEADTRGNIGDYEYDRDLSDKNTAVYHNKKTKQNYLGLRGTKDLKDLYTDLADPRGNILRGTQGTNPMYEGDLKLYDKVQAKYGGSTLTSGHSLGGSRAQNLSKKKIIVGQAFNLGRGFDKGMVLDKAKCSLPKAIRPSFCGKFTSHHIKGDALSLLNFASYGKHKRYKMKGPHKAHFMTNFYDQKG